MKLLAISGSLRQSSLNTQLLMLAEHTQWVSAFRLADIHFPLFDEDLEESDQIPLSVKQLLQDLLWCDAVLIATPEYNKNLSGVLKNALDWISRDNARPLKSKPVAICSVAAGKGGGLQAQYSLRHCLTPFQAQVLQGPELAISLAGVQQSPLSWLDSDTNRNRLNRILEALFQQVPVSSLSRETA